MYSEIARIALSSLTTFVILASAPNIGVFGNSLPKMSIAIIVVVVAVKWY